MLWLQGFNTTLRNLNNNTSHAATAAVAAAAAAAVAEGPAAAAAGPGIMAAPAARAPGGSRGRAAGGVVPGGPSVGESGTQNSASSAVELALLAPEGSSRTQDRLDLGQGVLDYISLTEHWASVADANEEFLRRTGRQKAITLATEERARAKAQAAGAARGAAGVSGSSANGSEAGAAAPAQAAAGGDAPAGSGQGGQCSSAAWSDAHRVGQLILAVGFEAGMWDLPSVLDIARQAADAIGNLVEEHGTPQTAAAAAAAGSAAPGVAASTQAAAPVAGGGGAA